MPSTLTLTLVDGVRVVVPNSLNLITPYVLLEQEDWFEDEIKFVRRVLAPGQQIIDIGANYGVYTLSMAQAVGPTGRVWAYEPASATAAMLADSLLLNRFDWVLLERSALSSACGSAQLSLCENAELNALMHETTPGAASETVPLVTLDERMSVHRWPAIDFLKIDAEGEERNILRGGARFFAEHSPLVQYEIKADATLQLGLVEAFAALGYDTYRLVPGLDLLVPFETTTRPDDYLLNLFCCKPDRAEQLAAAGWLVKAQTQAALPDPAEGEWRQAMHALPYGAQLAELWARTLTAGPSAEVDRALSLYIRSRDVALQPATRFAALEASFTQLKTLCLRDAAGLRLASLARVAQEYGARALAIDALQQLSAALQQHQRVDLREPFLPPARRFDTAPTRGATGNWVLNAVLEEVERLGAYSSFYTGAAARARLALIQSLGFGNPEMARRLRLLNERFGAPTASAC